MTCIEEERVEAYAHEAILVQKLNESSLYVLTPGPRGMWIFPLSILRFNIVRTVGSLLVQC